MKDIFNMFCIALLGGSCFLAGLNTAPSGKVCSRTDVVTRHELVQVAKLPSSDRYELQGRLLANAIPASALAAPSDYSKVMKGR